MDTSKRQWLKMTMATGLLAGALPRWADAAPAGAKPVVVVGQSVPLTGSASEIGLAYAGGAKLYFDAFNQRADSPARIELRQLDDGYGPAGRWTAPVGLCRTG